MLGENIRYARLKCGYSQDELVEKAKLLQNENNENNEKGFNKNQLSKWENNLLKPNVANLYKIATITNTSMEELYAGDYILDICKEMYELGTKVANRVQKQYLKEELEILKCDTKTIEEKMIAFTSCYLKSSSSEDEGIDFATIEMFIVNEDKEEKDRVRKAVLENFTKGVEKQYGTTKI